ncbi:MAG TPA: helix-turn-helix transcriptional regulator [bacterium]|nr:helix-turn-helix transcriptional regulator [bacterium]HPN35177.1 helix-turn-helix transcriptional regulator [bacterium]
MINHLRKYRFLAGELTQQELAERVQVSRQTIIAIEKGAFNPSVRLALKLSRVVNVRLEDLFVLEKQDWEA